MPKRRVLLRRMWQLHQALFADCSHAYAKELTGGVAVIYARKLSSTHATKENARRISKKVMPAASRLETSVVHSGVLVSTDSSRQWCNNVVKLRTRMQRLSWTTEASVVLGIAESAISFEVIQGSIPNNTSSHVVHKIHPPIAGS